MVYVEDVFEAIASRLLSGDKDGFGDNLTDLWRKKFIESVFEQIERERPLSTEQAKVVLSIITDVHPYLIQYGDITEEEYESLLRTPRYRREPYESIKIAKEVRHIGSNILAFRCKHIRPIIDDILDIRRKSIHAPPYYDFEFNVWIVPVIRNNIHDVMRLIQNHNFHSDDATDRWLAMAKKSYDLPSTFEVQDDIVVAKVYDNPILALWMENALGAEHI